MYLALATYRSLASPCIVLGAGFTEVAGRSHAYASSLQSAAGRTRAIQHNMVVLSIVSYISTD